MGDPRLLAIAQPVGEFGTPDLENLLGDMRETMRDLNGAGLAAPQIGVGLRVVIFGIEHNPRYPEAEPVPYTVLINPELTPIGDDMEEGWEGCLSVPGMRGLVPRYRHLRYTGFDAAGAPDRPDRERFSCPGRAAEVDHLDGILIRAASAICPNSASTMRCFRARARRRLTSEAQSATQNGMSSSKSSFPPAGAGD